MVFSLSELQRKFVKLYYFARNLTYNILQQMRCDRCKFLVLNITFLGVSQINKNVHFKVTLVEKIAELFMMCTLIIVILNLQKVI